MDVNLCPFRFIKLSSVRNWNYVHSWESLKIIWKNITGVSIFIETLIRVNTNLEKYIEEIRAAILVEGLQEAALL